jgi:hypothetical protein
MLPKASGLQAACTFVSVFANTRFLPFYLFYEKTTSTTLCLSDVVVVHCPLELGARNYYFIHERRYYRPKG